MVDLPVPLVPAECSMSGNDWFPLYGDRLMKSKWWRRASDTARSRNVMLWWRAYKESPAGSLPDDDDELAEMAGYGFDIDAFLAVKADIMSCWMLCSDGRYYHPTVCEMVLESWEKTSERRKTAAAKKAAQRAKVRIVPTNAPKVPAIAIDVPQEPEDVPRDIAENGGDIAIQDRTGQDRTISEAKASSVGSTDPPGGGPTTKPWERDEGFSAVWSACTAQMRSRAKSREKVWPEWLRAKRTSSPERILAGLVRYLAGDPDVGRTGGPGLHIWLRDRTFELWVGPGVNDAGRSAAWGLDEWRTAVGIFVESGRWSDAAGPPPDAPDCRAPPDILAEFKPVGADLLSFPRGAA